MAEKIKYNPKVHLFPEALLKASLRERYRHFRAAQVAHDIVKEVKEQVLTAIDFPQDDQIISVIGPTGAGKTTFGRSLERDLLRNSQQAMQDDSGFLPVAYVIAPMPVNGKFSWRDLFHQLLAAVSTKSLQSMRRARGFGKAPEEPCTPVTPYGITVDMRNQLSEAIRLRKVIAIVIDEANHMTYVGASGDLEKQMEIVKYFAQICGVPIILVGTYKALDLLWHSGQIVRRSSDFHLPRFDGRQPELLTQFADFAQNLLCRLPVLTDIDLRKKPRYIYEMTFGNPGLLKEWLTRALILGSRRNLPFGWELLKSAELSLRKLSIIGEEILAGEARMEAPTREYVTSLAWELPPDDTASPEAGNDEPATPRRGSRKRVGRRVPTKDPVGPQPGAR